ncbi:ATP-binding protein [Photobacterium nomapromontoriensis]|uniref:ATP-binding protein n=1 Tax=Photobacterium nomapromontoriensis TaxID=2910237 RepID=UPI003D09EA1D
MDIATSFSSEKLQETLLDLMRTREREKQLNDENTAMAGSNTKRQVFNSLLSILRKYISFEHALVLTRDDETAPLRTLVTTCRFFESSIWPVGTTFIRSINGESIALFDPRQVYEFKQLSDEIMYYCHSALVTGVKACSGDALLLFLHSDKGQFTPNCRRVLERFRPLLEHAIIDIDYRERLQSIVTARTQELTHSQQRFRDFANTVGDWFGEVDTDYSFTYISSSNIASHIVDTHCILDIFNENSAFSEKIKTIFIKQEKFEDVEWQLPENEGGLWISFSGTPYFTKQGQLLSFRGTAKDITSRKQRGWVNQMDHSAQLLLTIINDILDLSRIESTNFELFNASICLTECINLVVTQLHEQAYKKGIKLKVIVAIDVPVRIIGDKNRISQVLFNLVGNAIKFTHQGTVTIAVSRKEQQLQISVKDTGIGIAPDAQEMLFNPFMQADSSITRKYGGTGLGLAISQHLIRKMLGEILLESDIGIGSCFRIVLPLLPMPNDNATHPVEPTAAHYLPSLNILVAEDSPTNQLVAKLMLEKRGHQVKIANNGIDVIDMTQNHPESFDIIFMDISMPEMDGIQATQILRMTGVDLPIIALTANVMQSDQAKYFSVGMNDFLAKPILAQELNNILNKYQLMKSNT